MANKQKAWRTRAGDPLVRKLKAVTGVRQGKRLRDKYTRFVAVPSFLVQALLMRGGWAYQDVVQHG